MNPTPDHSTNPPVDQAPAPASPHLAKAEATGKSLPRRAVLGLVAAAALGAGTTAAWLQSRKSKALAVTTVVPDFWAKTWNTPDGAELAMQSLQGRPLLLNFWATWCPPCVEELPLINTFYQENKGNGWQVLGLAVDKPLPVQAFLVKTPLSFAIAMAGLGGTELSRSLGNLAGGLPFSVALGADGSIVWRKMGQVTAGDLQELKGLK